MNIAILETLTITSDPNNIAQVETFVEDIRAKYNIADDAFGNILISLTEAANNAIIHGNGSDISKTVEITVTPDERGKNLTFSVKDQGKGFDYSNLADPTAPENLDQPCGRGVFLMMQLADLVVFSDKGSTVEMKFRI
ncbi:MAG: ATP-binding region ATPase domain protein [Bacteroidetes bacterium]|nr:ATP-binding region ATPase domain protein [Bacteroidota bacterium]